MAHPIDPGIGRRTARAEGGRIRGRIRTVPPGLLLVGTVPGTSGTPSAADLIALARAARRDEADRNARERPEQG
ncbi:hypothetical protein MKK69_25190 [Methylobacterium sp. J-026]|uniref:hypothetical protein n=1 Tax=Methylobacterium sp. J-026 TaxID=2836624 RepID=UPI001FB8F8F5|nr:hypothetical protein [Methylobacterium sp. J-026]MCJ2137300.1 hypothetical protein [Methylobacterium sp. J-026]